MAVAKGVVSPTATGCSDEAHFDQMLDRRFDDGGPMLLGVKIDDKPGAGQTPRDPALIRFMKGLGTGRGGARTPSALR